VPSLEGDNFVVFHSQCIWNLAWQDGGIRWEWPYKNGGLSWGDSLVVFDYLNTSEIWPIHKVAISGRGAISGGLL